MNRMNRTVMYFLAAVLSGNIYSQSVGIGTDQPHPSAALEIRSGSKGLLLPRMDFATIDNMINPAAGLQVYDTTFNCLRYYNGSRWIKIMEQAQDPSIPVGESVIYGAGSGTSIYAWDIVTDEAGNIYTVGSFTGTARFGNQVLTTSERDGFVVKYDANGSVKWAKKFGGSNQDFINEVVAMNGSIYFLGEFYSDDFYIGNNRIFNAGANDVILARLDSDGQPVWTRQVLSNSHDYATGLTLDPEGNIYFCGYFYGSVLSISPTRSISNYGNGDGYIGKFNANGEALWLKSIGGSMNDWVMDLCYFNSMIGFTGYFVSTSIVLNAFTLTSNGTSTDLMIGKLDLNGSTIWADRYGTNDCHEFGYSVCADAPGHLYVGAGFQGVNTNIAGVTINNLGAEDGLFIRVNGVNAVFVTAIQSSKEDKIRQIAFANGVAYITGNTQAMTTITVAGQVFILKDHNTALQDGFVIGMNAITPTNPTNLFYQQHGSFSSDFSMAITNDIQQKNIFTVGRCDAAPAILGSSMLFNPGYYLWRFKPGY